MTERRVRWGILSTANIGKRSVIPGLLESDRNEVVAVASRNLERAQKFAGELGIANAYGSYEDLLNDPQIDAVYIPLPNHLHNHGRLRLRRLESIFSVKSRLP
ncbi:Gfo/Idh/MocA family protein [Bacillus niameyensis]|uniref:Gfo/Idh/MocA family protein n=1 Tax=Bacillus niameyensis TaxID=1522308 RepID=UPI000A528B9F|nr:Gfo/Idh/MocA family oxidoreductase [Bacillus niameyensis]